MRPRLARRVASLGLIALLSVALAAPADATFGGKAGRISFARELVDKDGPGLTGLEIFSAKANGKDVERLTWSNDGRTSFMSDWSPDGNRIAFDSDRIDKDGREDVVQIYTMPWNGETHGLTQLTVGPGFHGDPVKLLEQLSAREHATRRGGHQGEQVELRGGQLDRLGADRDAATHRIDDQVADDQRPVGA